MNKIAAALAALRYGASLTDPALWKQRQTTVNSLVGFFGAVLLLYPMEISHEDLERISGGIAVLLGLFNTYTTVATTTKIGFGTPAEPPDHTT
ncbi:MAG: hypothetical protein HYZ18_12785 [Pseudogulbenkiania sp.]|nr:hypothetical protein [Pseudogulbenkiania sp.]